MNLFSDKAAIELRKELADPRNYGMAKSMVMEGIAQGYDMTDEEQVKEWMAEYNQKIANAFPQKPSLWSRLFNPPSLAAPTSVPFDLPFSLGSGKQKADKAKKAKRKMKQATQKKNRKRK